VICPSDKAERELETTAPPYAKNKRKKLKNNPVGIINGTIMKSSNRK